MLSNVDTRTEEKALHHYIEFTRAALQEQYVTVSNWTGEVIKGRDRDGFKTIRFELCLLQGYGPLLGQGCSHLQALLEKNMLAGLLMWLLAGRGSSLATGQRCFLKWSSHYHKWWLASLKWKKEHPRQNPQSLLWQSQKWHSLTSYHMLFLRNQSNPAHTQREEIIDYPGP